MKSVLLFVALIFPALGAMADQQPLATISDPAGDDYGAGELRYPQRDDFQTGDLDLLRLKISRDEDGFWFEAMFRNPVHDPLGVPVAVGGESLANFARKGFYQFNVDVYVDTDRVRGSGNIFTLPGRQVGIDPAYAWERAVILTPRPELMRQQLLDAVTEQFPDWAAEAEARVDRSIFFPTQIRVRGKSVAFFVPASFFSGSDGKDWAVNVLVTGAMTNIPADLSLFPSTRKPLERLQLGVMQPATGRPRDTFGYSGSMPAPVVDMLCPSAEQQVQQLTAKSRLAGASWGPHAISGAAIGSFEPGASAAEQESAGSLQTGPVRSIGDLFQPPANSATAKPEKTGPAEAAPQTDPPIAARLRTLQQLFDQNLIDQIEYEQQRQRILKDL